MTRRQVRVRVSGELLSQWFTAGRLLRVGLVERGLPEGAVYIRCFDTPMVGSEVSLVFEHESFAEVEQGREIPSLDIVLRQQPPAPDLLAALKALRADEWRCTVDWGPRDERDAINEAVDVAIAKAEGR